MHSSDLATPNSQDMMSGCHRTNTCPLDVSNLTQWARMSRIAAEVETFAPVLLSDAGKAPAVTVLNATGGVPGWVATRPVLRLFPPHAPSPHAQGLSGFVATVLLVWRGHTKSTTARSGPGPDLAVRLQ